MAGLAVLVAVLAQVVAAASLWALWEVATTDGYLLKRSGRSKGRWLLVVLVPLLGPARWLEGGRPPAGVARVLPRRHHDATR